MILIAAGVALWSLTHWFKRFAPDLRARMGDRGKLVATIGSILGLGLMIWGYRTAEFVPVYEPLPGIGHLNNLMMLAAIYLYGVGHAKGRLSHKIRHPILIGTAIWAAAHLLVNGDFASILLFGGLGAWALVTIPLINAQEGPWTPATPVRPRGDWVNIAVALVIYAVIAALHSWAGYNPFMGTYA